MRVGTDAASKRYVDRKDVSLWLGFDRGEEIDKYDPRHTSKTRPWLTPSMPSISGGRNDGLRLAFADRQSKSISSATTFLARELEDRQGDSNHAQNETRNHQYTTMVGMFLGFF